MNESGMRFLSEEFRNVMQGKNHEKHEKWAEQLGKCYRDADYSGVLDILDEIEEEVDADTSSIRTFIEQVMDDDNLNISDRGDVEEEIGRATKESLKHKVDEVDQNSFIFKTDEAGSVGSIFDLQEEIYRDTEKMVFPIPSNHEYDGRVSVELEGTKQKIELLRVYKTDEGYRFSHIGESSSKNKGKKIADKHNHDFFIYKFVEDEKEYLLLSEKKLDPMPCKVTGLKLELSDFKQLGDNTGVPIDRDVIIAHSVDPSIELLDDEQIEEMMPDIDHDWLASRMLGDWRHPEWFEKMMLSIFFTNEEHGYPSGFLWMAETGTGKTKVLNSLASAFGEPEGVYTGTTSTVKGLTPSFADSPPDEGFLLKTQRVACTDEFFNLLSEAQTGNTRMQDVFRPLLDLVEHNDRQFSSGNGTIRGKMQGLMFGAGNNSYGVQSMMEAADKLDDAFLGRFLLYEQTEAHIKFIEDRKMEMDEQEMSKPEMDGDFVSLVDAMRVEKTVSVDQQKIKEIKENIRPQVPQTFSHIYRARYDHHLKNLASGHAKYRCLLEGDMSFEISDEDYAFAAMIVERLVNSWKSSINLDEMSLENRPQFLDRRKKKLLETVEMSYPIDNDELAERVDFDHRYVLKKLRELDLVVKDEGEYYPYHATEVSDGVKKFRHLNNGEGE